MKGELLIGGRLVSSIAAEFGTPIYIYDRTLIRWRRETLRKALPEELEVLYAVKANPHPGIIRIMGECCDGLDIASQGEMEKAIKVGISPQLMSFAGPGKRIDELRFALERQIGSISVESEREVEHIREICSELGETARIMVRVNPDFELNQSGMKMGGGATQFGIDAERIPQLIQTIRRDNHLIFQGIHVFSGSQNLNADSLRHSFEQILEYADNLSSELGVALLRVNLGGGLGIPYFAHEKDLDLQALGQGLKKLIQAFRSHFPETYLRIELGRFLVGECGIYLCRVLYRKVSHKKIFLITDGGMHHHLAASGNLGQSLIRRPMPIITANRLNGPAEKVTVVGPLCTPLDTFGTLELPHAEEGDLIAVLNSGAYGCSASPVGFISHKPPMEVVIQ